MHHPQQHPLETPRLKVVGSSQPKLVHTPSQQSIAASDDYYSFSDITAHSSTSKVTVVPYQTAPSRNPSTQDVHTHIQDHIPQPEDSQDKQIQPARAVASVRRPSMSRPPTATRGEIRLLDNGTPTPGADDSPYIRFAIDQLTRDEELRGAGRHGSLATTDYPVERIVPDEGLGYYTAVPNKTVATDNNNNSSSNTTMEQPESTDTLIAVDPPSDTYTHLPLTFIPYVLRPAFLAIGILLCLAMVAALIFCNVWSQQKDGLSNYVYFGGSKYFVFEFLPQLLGMVIVLWLFVVQAAVYRIAPLSSIARAGARDTTLQRLPMLPKNFVLPDLSHFTYGEPVVGVCLFVIWAVNCFTVPLLSCLFQPRYYGTLQDGGFRWVSVQGVGWTLVVIYALLVLSLFAILARFGFGVSGLQWDPVSLADVIPLIQRSNVLHDFDQSEVTPNVGGHLPPRKLRLGYWKTSSKPDNFYALGEESAPLKRVSSVDRLLEKSNGAATKTADPATVDVERQELHNKDSFERSLHSPFFRYRWAPWFLKDTFVVAWIIIAFVLLIAFLAVSFVNRPLDRGFLPLLPTLPSASGFSSSNFLFSFIPALLGNFLFLAWQPIDVYFRAAQAYSDLSSPRGAFAEKSLLLSYNSCLPLEATFHALFAGHYKVAYISFISVASLALPVLAGGVFMARFYAENGQVRISSYTPAYYTLVAFAIVYALSFLTIWPRRIRYLPHPLYTYADAISFLYQSPLLVDKVFREPRTKTDLITRTIVAPPGESHKALYAFGVYYGQDGKEHLGIDRLRRLEGDE
ncbi:uncharacterized protein GIQ15_06993 [Arthroderma uncinatum]|uniref:uncharacterized protein n=1 Tax=Arthroderma uncinatum TaxID=74035 RepID=UPI00144AD79A|nr:uncharacterized protein GIQ15_06993 [Arthroderma uncinatum]KAF3480017.1 hypothetical protein GIQ15_06993 [Arthroderma uncinatum]